MLLTITISYFLSHLNPNKHNLCDYVIHKQITSYLILFTTTIIFYLAFVIFLHSTSVSFLVQNTHHLFLSIQHNIFYPLILYDCRTTVVVFLKHASIYFLFTICLYICSILGISHRLTRQCVLSLNSAKVTFSYCSYATQRMAKVITWRLSEL